MYNKIILHGLYILYNSSAFLELAHLTPFPPTAQKLLSICHKIYLLQSVGAGVQIYMLSMKSWDAGVKKKNTLC